jgi:pilus assembly protein CpaE
MQDTIVQKARVMFASRTDRQFKPARSEARKVLVVSPDEIFCARQYRHLANQADYAVDKSAASSYEALYQARPVPDIILVDIDADRTAAIAAIERWHGSGQTGSIITFSETLDEASLRTLLRAGVKDWLPLDADAASVLAACEAIASRPRATRAGDLACFAFVPAAGGVGNTTLAIETAFLLARSDRPLARTCLVDLNFQSGSLADHLGVTPALDVKSLVKDPERLDSQLLDAMLARHSSGLAVMAAPRSPAEHIPIGAAVVVRVLDAASQMFDTLLIDMPPMWTPYSDHVIAGCDRVFIVTEPSVPALHRARDIAEVLPKKMAENARVRVIVNKWRRDFLGAALSKRDAEQVLNGFLAGFLPEDGTLVRDAINRGEQLSATSRTNKISRELARIVVAEAMPQAHL